MYAALRGTKEQNCSSRRSGTENEAAGCQSFVTHCTSINKEMLVEKIALCVCCINIAHSSQRKKTEVEVEGQEGRQKSKNRIIFTRPNTNGAP